MKFVEIHIFDEEKKAAVRICGEWEEIEQKLIEEYRKTLKQLSK